MVADDLPLSPNAPDGLDPVSVCFAKSNYTAQTLHCTTRFSFFAKSYERPRLQYSEHGLMINSRTTKILKMEAKKRILLERRATDFIG